MLVVIEGPDNVGKTSISKSLSAKLANLGLDIELLSFPGNREGTLGKFIHDFHHRHDKYGINEISNTSLQLLHVAAHLDTISEDILPAVNNKELVILDRNWWSTYVYGKVSGINENVLQKIMELEELAWRNVSPDIIFLISNEEPIGVSGTENWKQIRNEYMSLAEEQTKHQKIIDLRNNGTVEEMTQEIIGILNSHFNIL